MLDVRKPRLRPYALEGNFGLEREALRVTAEGRRQPGGAICEREVLGTRLLEPLRARAGLLERAGIREKHCAVCQGRPAHRAERVSSTTPCASSHAGRTIS